MKRMKLLFTLALPVLLLQNAQAQTMSRMTGQAHWYNDGVIFVPSDTMAYSYDNPNHGGDLNHTMKYTSATKWVFTDTSLANNQKMTQEFWGDDNIKSTVTQNWNVFSSTWDNTSKILFWYNGDNTMSSSISQVWGGSGWSNSGRSLYDYTFTTAGSQMYSHVFQHWFGADFFSDSVKMYSYDAMGRLKQEVDQDSVAGNWVYRKKYDYTYDTSNRIASVTKSTYTGSGYTSTYRYEYTYDAAGNRVQTLYSTWNSSTSAWDQKSLHTYSAFTSAHLPQVDDLTNYDTSSGGFWYPIMHYTYAYNAFSQMTSMTGESYNVLGFPEYAYGDPRANYYYTGYSVGVKELNPANGEVNVYPNPAQDVVNINVKWNEAQAFTVSIFNMNGAVVRQWAVPSTSTYSAGIPVENLATGSYIVKIAGGKDQITRQIVVAH